jgi:hypothetical protein
MLDAPMVTRTIQVVAVLSLFLALFVGFRQYQLADCLAQYNNDQASSSGQRLIAAEQDRQALDEMIGAFAAARSAPPEDAQRQVNAALDKYLEVRATSDEQRRKNPPPPPPSQRCD